mmetsp:Transcript_48969/g.72814  ORF Transcript_48969/g.72814 Transcript_48969/m.72814 type:complete len:155 (-) Transcript_48969:333-797(-)|eukprot:CAMPEP_0195518496 /NCGR_PEP_ID=MMETSP0794_2-20130614/13008_1 /TAXON_ID=515487 /ORGANISM="Stephanopyxis turris, Strain CCMP 815" /LENGTH=154 /DNA_ID=CAMNT_0040647467 /DNA_START=76 /DNA_END=543 /DNA_ORIENTATION=+
MGKSIRSKIKRQHRSEFRRTIGEDAAKASMDTIQSNLRACMEKGSMTSVQKLTSLFDTTEDNSSSDAENDSDGDDAMDTTGTESKSSRSSDGAKTVPIKANLSTKKKKKKYWTDHTPGQHGARLARKSISRMNARGQMKNGQKVVKKKPRTTRS